MIAHQIDPQARLVTCRITTGLRVLDVANFVERLWADPRFAPTFDTLVVVDAAAMPPDLVARNALAELLLAWRKLHLTARWALVVPGSAWRRITAQLIDEFDLADRNVCCFGELAAATSWLAQPRPAPAGPT